MHKGWLQQALNHIHPLSKFDTAYWLHDKAEAIYAEKGAHGFCIEIGTWVGYTAIAMAVSGVNVHAIDTFDARDEFTGPKRLRDLRAFMGYGAAAPVDMFQILADNVKKAMVDRNLTAFKMESQYGAGMYDDEVADLIFIDADHSAKAILTDLEVWPRVLKPGGLLVVDNYDGILPVHSAFDHFLYANEWPPAQHAVDVMYYSRKPCVTLSPDSLWKGAETMAKEEKEDTREVEPSMDAVSERLAAPPRYVMGAHGGDDKQMVAESIIEEAKQAGRLESLGYLCHEILARLK